jgi:HSP20 family protein
MIRSPFFNDFVTLRNSVDRLADAVFGDDPFHTQWSRSSGNGAVAQPMPLDVYATDEQAVLLAAVPGMRPEDLELSAQQNTVTISGTMGSVTDTEEAKGATWYLHELGSGSYRRSVTLPLPIDVEKATASFEHGILRVVLPKAETAKPKKIAIAPSERQAIGTGAAP